HYVTVCERFNFSTAESDYEECGAFHTAARNQAWYALWNPNNPASPLNVHKDGSSVRAQVTSVSFFKRASGVADLAQVRYMKARRAAGGGVTEDTTHWIATLEYAYADPSTDPRVRRWNPLGFQRRTRGSVEGSAYAYSSVAIQCVVSSVTPPPAARLAFMYRT